MYVLRALRTSILLASCAACGGGTEPRSTMPAAKVSPAAIPQSVRDALVLPPQASALGAMRSLEAMGDEGNVEAAWLRAHYLVDLFDQARFDGDDASHDLLAELSGRPRSAITGPAATQAIAELVVLEADRVLELDRTHAAAQSLRVLAEYDASAPNDRAAVFQAMQELKRIQSQAGPLAPNATLRLFGYCKNALLDAVTFSRPGQRIAVSHCLYPLFTSDPAPYFAEAPTKRPPPPSAANLMKRLAEFIATKEEFRLRAAFDVQATWIGSFSDSAKFISPLDAMGLRLPTVLGAHPYDDEPILVLGTKLPDLGRQLAGAKRRELAIALASSSPASVVLQAAASASAAGAETLSLLVATKQQLRVPAGDYWSGPASDTAVDRLGKIAFSLAPMQATAESVDRGAGTKAAAWNRQHSELSLHLKVSPSHWTLVSPEGQLAKIAIGNADVSAASALQAALIDVRKAYPDEQGLVLVPAGDASLAALVLAAEAATKQGATPLFPRLALATSAPRVRRGKALAGRVQRRAAAHVSVVPNSLSSKSAAALHCYQSLAKSRPLKSAEVRLELSSAGPITAAGGDAALRACATKAFASAIEKNAVAAAAVTFSARAK